MMSQGEAVFQAVSAVVGDAYSGFHGGTPAVELSKAQLGQVHALVFKLFNTGETQHKGNPTPEELLKYIPGLVNNWLRKDKRLNGGVVYQAKRPGSRTGSGDETLKNMRLLLQVTTDSNSKAQIQAAIDERVASLKPKGADIDISKLPEHLKHLVAVSR